MKPDYLTGPQAELLAEMIRCHPLMQDANVLVYSNDDGVAYHVSVAIRIRESRLQGRPAAYRETEDESISAARALVRCSFVEVMGREPREGELTVAEFARHILDCRIKI
jgi:hypothetical protein